MGSASLSAHGIAKIALSTTIAYAKKSEFGLRARSCRARRRFSREPLVRVGRGTGARSCPECRETSESRHSWHVRRLQDLPIQGAPVCYNQKAPRGRLQPTQRLGRTASATRGAADCRGPVGQTRTPMRAAVVLLEGSAARSDAVNLSSSSPNRSIRGVFF
jgi:hypothetical protein